MLGRLRSEIHRHVTCCLCLHCSAPLRTMQVSRMLLNHLLSTVGCHWLKFKATGQEELVIDHLWGPRLTIHSQPALKMADWPSLLAESWFAAAEDRQSMAMHFQGNVCTTTLLIMFETQRSMVLDPQAINHAFQCMVAQGAKCAF